MPNFSRVFVDNSFEFITVAINNRNRSLLADYMTEFKLVLKTVKNQIRFEIYAIAVMPDHFYMILKPDCIMDYPKIVSLIKTIFTKNLSI